MTASDCLLPCFGQPTPHQHDGDACERHDTFTLHGVCDYCMTERFGCLEHDGPCEHSARADAPSSTGGA